MTDRVNTETGEVTSLATIEPPDTRIARLQDVGRTLDGPQFVSDIQGRRYPKVEWWTTVAAHAGLTALESGSRKVTCADHEGKHYGYESSVEIMDSDGVIRSRASMICLSCEVRSKRTGATWGDNGEYAVKSMSLTRATSKAFRVNLSYLAVLAGLEATPAEEVPRDGFGGGSRSNKAATPCTVHDGSFWALNSSGREAHPVKDGSGKVIEWCNREQVEARGALGDAEELDRQAAAHLGGPA